MGRALSVCMKTTADGVVSAKIVAIRTANGGAADRCPTCAKPAANPYRRQDADGRIIEGCIDATHTGHLVSPSSTQAWHTRPWAIARRREELASLKALS